MGSEKQQSTPRESVEDNLARLEKALSIWTGDKHIDDEAKKDLENGVKTGSVGSEFLEQLYNTGKNLENLQRASRMLLPEFLGKNTYFSDQEKEMFEAAKSIQSFQELEMTMEFLGLAQEKLELLTWGSTLAGDSGTATEYDEIKGLKLYGLKKEDLEKVHDMPLKSAVSWLKKFEKRHQLFLGMALDGAFTDQASVDRLRSMDVSKSLTEMEKLKHEFEQKKKEKQKEREEQYREAEKKELKDLEKQLEEEE